MINAQFLFLDIALTLALSTMFFTYLSTIIQCCAEKTKYGQESQHCKDCVQRVVRYAPCKKSWLIYLAAYYDKRATRRLFMAENYFLVKPRIRRYIIYALLEWKRARGSEEEKCTRVARDTARLELQGSKDVGTCRDLQSRNYGYTIDNDTAQTRARFARAIIFGWVPHETARYTIERELRARWRRKSATRSDQLRLSLGKLYFFFLVRQARNPTLLIMIIAIALKFNSIVFYYLREFRLLIIENKKELELNFGITNKSQNIIF